MWEMRICRFGFLILVFRQSLAQRFIDTCNDPLINPGHDNIFGHSYCSHACFGTGVASCLANGDCMCPCSPTPTGRPDFSADVCPPNQSDLPDPNPLHLAMCKARCIANCPTPGGDGSICGEIPSFTQSNPNVFVKICTCSCPLCLVPTTTTTTTTTTPAPTAVTTSNPTFPLILLYKLFWYYLFLLFYFKKIIYWSLKCFFIAKAVLVG